MKFELVHPISYGSIVFKPSDDMKTKQKREPLSQISNCFTVRK